MNKEDTCLEISDIHTVSEGEYQLPSHAYHALMPFKVREILLVSSLYDAYIIEEEGLISELVIGEYRHLLLSSPPRVTRATSGQEALSKVTTNKYDLVITMSKNIGMDPFVFGRKIKEQCSDLPVIILATDTADLIVCEERTEERGIDKAFFWYGDTSLFMAIIKYVEDKINAKYDTVNGDVRVIILVEDSIRFYSVFLPLIYTEIVKQTQRAISEDINEMQRLLRRRARPKILLANNYEEAIALYKQYREFVLGIISDVKFKRDGKLNLKAGHDLIQFVKKDNKYIPTLLQSTDSKNRKRAEELGAYFIHKNSPTLLEDFDNFMLKHLGFGDFIFLLPSDKKTKTLHEATVEISRASNMEEFEKIIQKVPLESIRFHANRNDFSNWLMARGEFQLAMKLRPRKVSDFNNLDEVRKHLTHFFNEARRERHLGVMTDFSKEKFEFESSFTKIGGESLGGKGRGIAFIRSLLARYDFYDKFKDVNIVVPNTVVIGTKEFDKFLSKNNLYAKLNSKRKLKDEEIAQIFLKGDFSDDLKKKLKKILKTFKSPIAIRSSSLLEDSQNFPFAGLYSTYMLPNNHKSISQRLDQLTQAIKLIYASVFFKEAKAYIESTASKIEEEKMAIVIQELIGNDYNGRFYPTFSGVAQSYNFYPVSHQKREDGVASIAVGLGYSVVGGEKVIRFSPRHPGIIPEFSNPKLIFENTQTGLYVLNTKNKNIDLSKKDENLLQKMNISDIKNDGSLEYVSSTYDREDEMIRDSFSEEGPFLITFAGILKYDIFPLTSILQELLEIGQRGMGSPVEIEFAVNFDKEEKKPPTFAVLQIRPLVVSQERYEIEWDEEDTGKENVLIHSKKALGNGVIDTVKDIVYVIPKKFDSSKTIQIADEIGKINKNLANSQYLLIGPGRWGTQDRWLGIPVRWSQISNVKVMVETAIEEFNIKPTQGTHFFQNIISKGIGYINTTLNPRESVIDWNWLDGQKAETQLKYVRHLRLKKPLMIKFDGRVGRVLVTKAS